MAIDIPESKLLPYFDTGERKVLREIGNVIFDGIVAEIALDPTVLQINLTDLEDVIAPSPVENDELRFDGTDWESFSPSSSYTAVVSDSVNLDGSDTSGDFLVARTGNWVSVSGRVSVDPTGNGATEFQITLPFASSSTQDWFLSGSGVGEAAGPVFYPVRVSAVIGSPNKAKFAFLNATGTAEVNISFVFNYSLVNL